MTTLTLIAAAGWACALWQFLRCLLIEDRSRAVSRELMDCMTRPNCTCGLPRK